MAPSRSYNLRLATNLVLANLLLGIVLAGLVTLAARSSRTAYEARARETAANMVSIAQSNIASELARVDSMMEAALGELEARRQEGGPGPDPTDRILQRHHQLLPGVEGLRLTDARGMVRWGNDLPPGTAVDVSDRDYFVRVKAGRGTFAVLSGPLKSRVSGHWVLVVARPVIVSGKFDGVMYASIAHDQFQAIFSRFDLGDRDAVTLRTSDLRLVARYAPGAAASAPIGNTEVSAQFASALQADRSHGTFVSRTALDGIERINAYRGVDGWPLMLIAGLERDRFFEPWYTQTRQSSLLALVTWALVATATFAMYRAWSRDAELLRELASQTHRTQELLRVAADGIHILDRTGHLVMLSDSFAQMLGSTPEKMLGRHVSTWDATQSKEQLERWFAGIRSGHRQRVEIRHRRDDGSIIDVELQVSVTEIEGELLVFAATRDITAQHAAQREASRLLREQTAMLDNDIVAMAKLEETRLVWKNRALDRMFGYGTGELDGQSAAILFPDEASFSELNARARQPLRAGSNFRTQVRMRHKNGHLLWVDLSGVALSDVLSFWMMVDITAMKEAQSRIEHIAFHDALTQLPNRLLLHDRLGQAILGAERAGTFVAVCYLDLDGFKRINDEHGHDAGDALLVEIAHRIQGVMRAHDTAARIGGDEFVLVLTMLASPDDWQSIVERAAASIREPVGIAGMGTVRVGVSVGVALAPLEGVEPDALLAKADQAMLRAKRAGKNRVEASQ